MRTVRAALGLGSNLAGPRRKIAWALRELNRLPGTRLLSSTTPRWTAPLGRVKQPDFLNCVAWVRTSLSPMGLLTELKRLEVLAGRKPGARWGPRPLDLDILYYGDERISTAWLTIPHRVALARPFVREDLPKW
ncbi:MAG: 2-amino-4-hydroxy-6-hydroxymethyldihydropteridine diphosphokinase [Elusimicrobia bacterium]|nr:2-amino-4-hydroxy-6-hydroxymethyldihydropteridine diphosphokinase [Elusimicrobiota bacterium]